MILSFVDYTCIFDRCDIFHFICTIISEPGSLVNMVKPLLPTMSTDRPD